MYNWNFSPRASTTRILSPTMKTSLMKDISTFSLHRIPVVAAHVLTMESVKLDLPVKVFVVSVDLDSQEQTVINVN